MHPYPHLYDASASGGPDGNVRVASAGLPDLSTAPPPEFDGPGGTWSPETLLCAAVADCFVLSFRAVSRAARLPWRGLECGVSGTLERADGTTRFTRIVTRAVLTIAAGTDEAQARALLERAEHVCLISNSLSAARTLDTRVVMLPG